MTTIDLDLVSRLYRTYTADLAAVIHAQRRFRERHRATMTPQLDDLEAEITYLLLRAHRPASVMELGTFHGWSTSWLLSALRDNGAGHLHSFDRIDRVVATVPAELSAGRWTFVPGDVRANIGWIPADLGHLFVDADHGRRFGRWYLAHLFPLVPAGIPVSVHDVFHGRRAQIWSEGAEVLRWLRQRGVPLFTASRRHSRENFEALAALKNELGLGGARGTTANPMIYFLMP